jgi:hypothetical protein
MYIGRARRLTLPANSLHLQGQKQHAPACMVALWQAPAFRVRGRRGERPVVCAPDRLHVSSPPSQHIIDDSKIERPKD